VTPKEPVTGPPMAKPEATSARAASAPSSSNCWRGFKVYALYDGCAAGDTPDDPTRTPVQYEAALNAGDRKRALRADL